MALSLIAGDEASREKEYQKEIESKSKVISGLLKLSEHLEKGSPAPSGADHAVLQSAILDLQQEWHGLWLTSLEQQYLLEEHISNRRDDGAERLLNESGLDAELRSIFGRKGAGGRGERRRRR
ncbi:PREDICTED: uncharacterized protein LOC106819549 [Priapulus caudatus]|uniref:Uncharacterized protein LOC106819549 n=1 Tax=Priapulus caudatus TaxID=37621 RepID=A0ABM1F5D2_PRICU|nr:PREDICTED: uncharacterized protein LOC106819549 [Priapulus caudatus]